MRALPSAASSALLFLLATLSVQVRAFAPFGPSVVLRQQQQQQQRRAACGQKPTRSASSTYSVIHVKCSKAHARASALQAFGPGGGPGRRGPESPIINPAPLIGLALFLLFPGLLFNIINAAFILILLAPIALTVGFNIFIKLNTIEKPCPVCGAVVQGQKESLTQCSSCGSLLQADGEKFVSPGGSGFSGRMDDLGLGGFESFFSQSSRPQSPPPPRPGSRSGASSRQQAYREDLLDGSKIIDVEVIPDED